MKKVTAVLNIIFGVLLFLSPPAYAGDIELGKQVFTANCTACHAGGRNVVQAQKTLKQDALEAYLDNYGTEHNISAIVYQVTNGKNAMPAFGGRLTAEQIENVAAYVNDQAENGWTS
ncbi:MAG: c-type cytochrome [Cyanobacteria bacterium P01_D01_bin.105]